MWTDLANAIKKILVLIFFNLIKTLEGPSFMVMMCTAIMVVTINYKAKNSTIMTYLVGY